MMIALLSTGLLCFVIGYASGRWDRNAVCAQLREDLESRRQTIVEFSGQIDTQSEALTVMLEKTIKLERENQQLRQVGREVAKFANQQFPAGE